MIEVAGLCRLFARRGTRVPPDTRALDPFERLADALEQNLSLRPEWLPSLTGVLASHTPARLLAQP